MPTRAQRAEAVLVALEQDHSKDLTFEREVMDLEDLHKMVVPAWNVFVSAWISVENALSAASRQRTVRLAHEGKALSGRYFEADQDLLRAAGPNRN